MLLLGLAVGQTIAEPTQQWFHLRSAMSAGPCKSQHRSLTLSLSFSEGYAKAPARRSSSMEQRSAAKDAWDS